MGNDGGSIPKRRELVKEAARNPTTTQLKESIAEAQAYAWSTDPLTNRPLIPPVVSDFNGRLFNKDAILEYLLQSSSDDAPKRGEQEKLLSGAVAGLRDVVEVKFETDEGSWVCPITKKTLGPAVKSVYLVPCGHVFSEAAVKEAGEGACLVCSEPYAGTDVIPILPVTEAEMTALETRMENLKASGKTHSLKKATGSKKRKKGDGDKVPKLVAVEAGTGLKNSSTASLTTRVLEEQEQKKKKLKKNENLSSLFTKDTDQTKQKKNDFFSRGFTIPTKDKA